MKKKVALSFILALFLFVSGCAKSTDTHTSTAYTGEEVIIILHTNDVHGGIDDNIGYAGLAAYKNEMEEQFGAENIVLVDAGDYVQGSSVTMLTQGEAAISLMNAVDYDYVTLGNHEFDYQIPRMFELVDMLEAQVLSSNFVEIENGVEGDSVFSAYELRSFDGVDVAFIGITTPESLTKASPQYFQNAQGEYIYGFYEDMSGESLYANVQESIDSALDAGAEYVVAIAHLGIEELAAPWRSTDLIANTSGLDVVIDGHSHSVIEGEVYLDRDGNEVLLSQTGTRLANIGAIHIYPNNNDDTDIQASLISAEMYTEKDPTVQAHVDEVNSAFVEILRRNVAYTSAPLIMHEGETSALMQETNLGDLVADAYREILDTDVAIVNGGGIRANVDMGDINYGEIIELHPYSNNIISMEVSGQVIMDALEMGAKSYPLPDNGFLQVSGITYEINSSIPSSVQVDENGAFVSVDGEYRVNNIMVNNEALDVNSFYSLASHDYLLKKAGDGMTMFQESVILKDMFMVDSELLIKYFTENLNGEVGEEYTNPNGMGRIRIL